MQVLIAIGGNLGDRYGTFRQALALIAARIGTLDRVSRVHETAAVVLPGSSAEGVPAYLNAAISVSSDLPPLKILDELQEIERKLGRNRDLEPERWMSRILDLDLLGVDVLVSKSERLTLPHPELHKRDFVLRPLSEVAPGWLHPVLRKSVIEMHDAL